VVKEHFGGSNWPLSNLGLDTGATVYVGLVAMLINYLVVVLVTVVLRALGVRSGPDRTRPQDYTADADDPMVKRLDQLLDGLGQPTANGSHRPTPTAARVSAHR
jgi:solute:Na+ symporter, SSS family